MRSGKEAKLPVILIHGLASSHYDWDYLEPALQSAGYLTFSLDLLGHGDSLKPGNTRDYQYKCLREDFFCWVDGLKLDLPPVLVGHSLGGYLALDYALRSRHPVSGLLLISPFYSGRQLPVIMRIFYKAPLFGVLGMRLAPQWLIQFSIDMDPVDGKTLSPRARRQMAADTKRAAPEVLYFPRTLPDLTAELPKISTMSLVVWGEKDSTLNPSSFPPLVAAMPGAHGRVIPAIGHQPHLGKSEVVNEIALEFLGNLPVAAVHPAVQGVPAK